MSQRSQRKSSRVTTATPCARCSGGRRAQRVGHHEHGGRDRRLRERMRARRDAARHLQVDALVVPGVPRRPRSARICAPAARRRAGWRCGSGRGCAASRARCSAQAEERAAVDRDHLVHAVAEDEAAIEHRDLRFGERHELAVQVAGLRHGVLPLHFLNHSRMAVPRAADDARHRHASPAPPPGYSPSGLPSSVTLTTPTFWPALHRRDAAAAGCTKSALTFSRHRRAAATRSRSSVERRPSARRGALPDLERADRLALRVQLHGVEELEAVVEQLLALLRARRCRNSCRAPPRAAAAGRASPRRSGSSPALSV